MKAKKAKAKSAMTKGAREAQDAHEAYLAKLDAPDSDAADMREGEGPDTGRGGCAFCGDEECVEEKCPDRDGVMAALNRVTKYYEVTALTPGGDCKLAPKYKIADPRATARKVVAAFEHQCGISHRPGPAVAANLESMIAACILAAVEAATGKTGAYAAAREAAARRRWSAWVEAPRTLTVSDREFLL